MGVHIRPAVTSDARHLFDIRRASILELAPPVMPIELARRWADAHQPDWIYDVLRDRAVWVLLFENQIAGWISATANNIDGLYTRPSHVRSGVGSQLLRFVEAELCRRGFCEATLHGSHNAIEFYTRAGYEAAGPHSEPDGSQYGGLPMRKPLRPDVV
jgi:putative acetyltransferase